METLASVPAPWAGFTRGGGSPLSAAFDEYPDGVLEAGPDGQVMSLNRAGGRLLGLDPAAVIGHDYRAILPLADTTGTDWWRCTDPYGGLTSRVGQPERMLELVGGPRRGRFLLVTARYVRDADRRVVRLVVAFRGTAARDRAERDRADLVSTVAHEIRSPLTGVKGFTATLLSRWEQLTDPQKLTMLAAVNADADRVTRLLSDLLDVSRIDAGRLTLRRRIVDLPTKARIVIDRRVAAGDPPDRFVVSVAPGLPELWLDPDKVVQIIGNLVENAVTHGSGTVTIEIAPATVNAEPAVSVTVTDEGTGVSTEIAERIFSRFWRQGHGTGLGLYIARGLAEAHGGTVELIAGASRGAQFRVVLPAGKPPYV